MNIKQHIEAGHYEKVSDHVYALRTRDGEKAFIYTTRHHPEWEIVGGIDGETEAFCWQADGKIRGSKTDDPRDLLPPPPRKVKERGWAVINKTSGESRFFATHMPAGFDPDETLVDATLEFEVPWSAEPVAQEASGATDAQWRARLARYRPGKFWLEGDWGPRPESGNSRVPADMLGEWYKQVESK